MHRNVPNCLLLVVENWFDKCYTCVKWLSTLSAFFKLECGIRQGGVLSPRFLQFTLMMLLNLSMHNVLAALRVLYVLALFCTLMTFCCSLLA